MPPVISDEELALLLGEEVSPCPTAAVTQQPDVPPDALTEKLRAALAVYRASFARGGCRHPYTEVIEHEGHRYEAVGLYAGPSSADPTSTVNILCTVQPARTIRDAASDVVVHRDGAPVYLSDRSESGRTWEVWALHHHQGREVRWWISRSRNGKREDDPRGAARMRMLTEAPWIRRVG